MTLRSQKMMLFTLVLLIFIALATPPISFAAQNLTLSVDPSSGTITDPTYTINVNISHVDSLWGIHFQLSFNNGTDFLQVDIPGGVEPGDLMTPQADVDINYASVGGVSYLDVTLLAPGWENNETVTGEGSIAQVTFRLKENAEPEMISWLKFEVADATVFTGENFNYVQPTLGSGYWVKVGLLTTDLTLSAPSTAYVEKPFTISANLTDGGGNPIASQTVDFYLNSEKLSDETDTQGVASISYTPSAVGTLSVQAAFNESSIYGGSSSAIVQITVNKMSTTLTLDVPWSIKVQDTVNLVATLKKDTDPTPTPIVGATIGFSISPIGWTGSATTDSSGIASIQHTFNTVAYYQIKAEYLGTEKYASSSHQVDRAVALAGTTLALTQLLYFGKVDEPTTMSAVLKDELGTPLANFDIYFNVYTEPLTRIDGTTNSQGNASVEYMPQIWGWFQIEAIYEGNLTYTGSSSLLGSIWVDPLQTNLTLSAPTASVDRSTVITTTLEDENGNPINEQPVQFYLGSEEIEGSPTSTNSSGIASITFTPTTVGTFKVKAIYNGSVKYAESSDTADLTVNRMTSTLSLNVPASAKVDDQIALITILKDQDENPISYSVIDYEIFQIGWIPLDTRFTNESGIATFNYNPTQSGTFRIRAKYGGDPKHTGSNSEEATLTINKLNTILTISMPANTTTQKSITISATLKDERGQPLSNSTVNYYIFDNTTGEWTGIRFKQTSPIGVASFTYTFTETGTLKLKATYAGDQKYAGSDSEEATLIVTSGGQATPGEPAPPWWDFLFDEDLTVLDILFWFVLIMLFSTIVIVVIWTKIK